MLMPVLACVQRRGAREEEGRQHGADLYCVESLEGRCVVRTPSRLRG